MAENTGVIDKSEQMINQRKLAFDTLKRTFDVSFDGGPVPYIDNKRVKNGTPINLVGGGIASALLFDHYNGKESKQPVEERLLVTVQKGAVESIWEVSEGGLRSFNANMQDAEIDGQRISLLNPNYPIGGWIDDTDAACPDDFNNMIGRLLSQLDQKVIQ